MPAAEYKTAVAEWNENIGMASLTLAFLRPPPGDSFVNRLTARASAHGISHVELVFDGGLAFSIYFDRPPFLRQRSMANPGYELVSLAVSKQEYRSALQFCRSAVAEAYPFDHVGMYLSTVHPGWCAHKPSSDLGKTFCSKIIAEALQFADVEEVQALCPSSATPSRLYAAVHASQRRVCHNFRAEPQKALALTVPLRMGPII